jgi:general secretion pathway protein L
MKIVHAVGHGISRWIDTVVGVIVVYSRHFTAPRLVKLSEDESGNLIFQPPTDGSDTSSKPESFRLNQDKGVEELSSVLSAILVGSRVELILQPTRFVFRPIDLPQGAAEFLHGIVQTQIDRLTPWTAANAAFGWSAPTEDGSRLVVNIAATAKSLIQRYVEAITEIGASSVSVFASPPASSVGAVPIKIWDEEGRYGFDKVHVRRCLVGILVGAVAIAAFAISVATAVTSNLEGQRLDIERQISGVLKAVQTDQAASSASISTARAHLVQRKNEIPPAVMILEILSRLLPEHTYVTELRLEADKLRLVGITKDAPSLIALLEQSGCFTRATFFAPTTRSEMGERFHIEAIVQPVAAEKS